MLLAHSGLCCLTWDIYPQNDFPLYQLLQERHHTENTENETIPRPQPKSWGGKKGRDTTRG